MLQSERQDVKQKFDCEQQLWEEMYHKRDYQSKGFQWRKNSAIELCIKYLPPGTHLLDLGCGCGHASVTLARLGYQVLGADISEPMISQAITNARLVGLKNCRFEVFDFAKDDPQADRFDGLIALGFIEYFDDPVWVLKRMHQLLKQDGVAMVQIWNRKPLGDFVMTPSYNFFDAASHPWRQMKRIGRTVLPETVVRRLRPAPPPGPSRVEPKHRRYTPAELGKMAEDAGFKIIDARGSRFFPSKFFFNEGKRVRWDEELQRLTRDKPFMREQAIDYVAALRKL